MMNLFNGLVFDLMLSVIRSSGSALLVALAAEILVLILNALRVPKRIGFVLLWIVLLRMLVPVGLPSRFSIFNLPWVQEAVSYRYDIPDNGGYVGDYDIAVEGTETYDEAIYAGLEPSFEKDIAFQYVHYTLDDEGNIQPASTYREKYGTVTALVWLGSILLFWGYGILSALLLKRRVATATILEPGVYETDQINAPFILGVFRPKIYLPVGLDAQQREMVLCHERMHLRWGDHIVKIIAYFAAGLHWYNVWLGLYFYRVFLEQMEESCDQDVLQKLGAERKADYSEALLNFSTKRQFRQVVTVAFGESWIKERIQQVLKYKKPWRWLTVPSMVLVLAAAVSLGTSSLTQEGTLIQTQLLTREEMEQAGLPGSVIRFDMTTANEVASVAYDLEVWTNEGLMQRERILESVQASELSVPAETTVEWAFDLKSETSLQGYNSLDWNIRVDGKLVQGSIPLSDLCLSYHGMFTGLIGQGDDYRFTVGTNDSVVLFCGLFHNDGPNGPQISCAELSALDTVPLEEGQTAVVLRMHQYNSARPFAITIHDLLPEDFTAEPMMDIAAEGKAATLSGEKAKELRQLLSDISFTYSAPQGHAAVADEGLPQLRLYGKNGAVFEITVSGHYLLIYDVANGTLEKALGDHLACRRLAAILYQELGVEKATQEVYQMPEIIGETAYSWTLTAAIPSKDIWLYNHEETTDSLILHGLFSELDAFYSGDLPVSMEYQDFSGDGQEEIAVFCQGERGQRLYILTPTTGDDWYIDLVGQGNLNYWMDSAYGEYADNSDLAEIVMDKDHLASLPFSKTEVLGEWADAKYVHDQTEDHYRDARFYEQGGHLFVTATRVLHMQKDGQERYIPCAQVTAEIRYRGAASPSDPFYFCNFSLQPV